MIVCAASNAQLIPKVAAGKLTGQVADAAANTPIAKAFVLVHQPEGKKDFIVKVSNGKFELSLPSGLYDVFVSASGFAPSCKKIKISAGQSAAFNPRLQAESDSPGAN
jgi:hypothetical protein